MTVLKKLTYSAAPILLFFSGLILFAPPPTVDNSALVWVDSASEAARSYRRFQAQFGADEVFAVRLAAENPADLIPHVERFHAILEASPLVERVISAKSFPGDARTSAALDGPLNRTLGLLRAENGTALVIGLGRVSATTERETLQKQLKKQRQASEAVGIAVRIAGNPLINLALDRAGSEVERVSMPILIGVCVIFLILFTRSVLTTIAALLPAGIIVKASDAVLGFAGIRTNIVANIAKPLLFVLLLAGALHIIVGWQDAVKNGVPGSDAPFASLRKKGTGVFLALFTSAMGFGSLILSHVPPIRIFGIISAGGLLLGAAYLLVLLPVLLRFTKAPAQDGVRLDRIAARICRFSARLRQAPPTLAVAVVVIGIILSLSLVSDPHAIRYFKQDHPLRADHEALEREGVGLAAAEVVIEAPDSLLTAAGLARLFPLADALGNLPAVKQVIGPPLLIQEALFRGGFPAQSTASDTSLSPLLSAMGETLRDFASKDGKQVRLSLLIGTLDADELNRLHEEIRGLFDEHFGGLGVSSMPNLTITGNYEILLSTQAGLLDTLRESLLVTAILMTLLFLLFLKSWKLTAAALLPNLFPVCLNFIIMHTFKMPLDVGTSMTAAIALGIAVDDTLHFVLAFKKSDIDATARSTGRAIILSTLIISAGFVSLMGSDFTPTRNFGILCGSAMISALVADLIILPPLLLWIRRRRGNA